MRVCSCLLILLPFSLLTAANIAAAPPNVLIISADDHAAYVYGAYGNPRVRTPQLDRFADSGLRFDRAYCNSPVCTASRQSFLTGRYPRTIGVTQLRTPLSDAELTLAEMLGEAGYATAAIGKMHFNSDLTHGFDLLVDRAEHQAWLRSEASAAPLPEGLEVLPPWRPFRDPARVWLNGFYRPYGARDDEMLGTFLARTAVGYLAEERQQPFFMIVSFHEPHSPFHFPVEYAGRHDPADFDVSEVGPEDDEQIPEIFRDLTREEKQGIIASYYTSTEFLDKNVGLVLAALEASGQADETLVVYLGDHGYMLGQHGRFEKHCSFEPAVRSPLVMRIPGATRPGSSTAALVEFVDIVPTILDYCEVTIPATVQGRSLRPLIAGATDTHREHVVVEYAENEEALIRTDRWKLVYTTGNREREDGYTTGRPLPGRTVRLYDQLNDPDELHNLAGEPQHKALVDELTRRLADHLVRTAREPERIPQTEDVHELLAFCLQPHDVTPPDAK